MAKKSSRRKKGAAPTHDAATASAKGGAVYLPVAVALCCAAVVIIPWMLEAFGVHLPEGLSRLTIVVGLFGLAFILASMFWAIRRSR
jgi:hypothetical protein